MVGWVGKEEERGQKKSTWESKTAYRSIGSQKEHIPGFGIISSMPISAEQEISLIPKTRRKCVAVHRRLLMSRGQDHNTLSMTTLLHQTEEITTLFQFIAKGERTKFYLGVKQSYQLSITDHVFGKWILKSRFDGEKRRASPSLALGRDLQERERSVPGRQLKEQSTLRLQGKWVLAHKGPWKEIPRQKNKGRKSNEETEFLKLEIRKEAKLGPWNRTSC